MFTIWVYLAVFIIQSQFEAFLYLTQLFLFDQRIPQGASSPFQEKLKTFPLIQVKKYYILTKNQILIIKVESKRKNFLTRCLNEIWILGFWIHIWKILALWIDFLNCVICLSIVLSSRPASFSALESGPFDWLLINLANRTSSSLCFSCISSNLSPEKF